MSSVHDMAICIRISGYSDKIFEFASTYLSILKNSATKNGFEESLVLNSMEQCKAELANSNVDVNDHAKNNHKLFLIPHLFHDKLTSNVLSEKLKDSEENGLGDFDPGLFLKDQVLGNVTEV